MYEEFYGFTGRPFQLTPDHKFFFESSVHRKAASYLLYGLNQGEGFIVITGEVGAGKTTLLQYLLSTLNDSQYVTAQIVTSQLGADDVLRMVAQAFGLEVGASRKARVLSAIEDFLMVNHQQGRRCLLLIDEAQNLSIPALEELRMLSNLQSGSRSPMQSFLIGQPQFRKTLSSRDLEQLRQRVIASFHLGPMTEAETAEYIRHRLRMVAWRGDPEFPDEVMAAIYRHSGGVPRRINTLASRLLLFGVLDEVHRLSAEMVDAVAEELLRETEQYPGGEASAEDVSADGELARRIRTLEARCNRHEQALHRLLRLFTENLGLTAS
jgi:general secretion pathway protein A